MRKTLSLMALLGTGIATCLFAASPIFGDEPGNRVGEKPQSAEIHHPDMVFSTDARKGSYAGDKRQRIPEKAEKSASEGLGLRGSTMFMSSWGDYESHYGIYNIPYTQGMEFTPVFTSTAAIGCGYENGDGLYYGFARVIEGGQYVYRIYHYDMETGEIVASIPVEQDMQASDIAVDPTTGKAYGCCPGENDSFVWAQLDYATGQRTDIAQLSMMLSGIGADKKGNFYAVGKTGKFYSLDKTNGRLTLIGDTKLNLQYLTGGCFNDRDNTFLMSYCTDASAGIAEIDITTGDAVILKELDPKDDITCLYIPLPEAADKAPAKPELSVTSAGGSLDVSVSLTMPSTLYDGTSAAGTTMGYSIYADDVLIKEGTATAGQKVTETATMAGNGIHRFKAECSNAAGKSPKVKCSYYAGYGVPSSPKNVKLLWNDGTGILTWQPVTTCTDEGYINPQEVTYTVYDSNDNVVADNIAANSYSVSLPLKDAYYTAYYKVAALNHGVTSAVVKSYPCGIGSYEAPYAMNFNSLKEFNYNTVYDANEDAENSSTWQYDSQYKRAVIHYHAAEQADDWLFSPNIRLESGYAYVLNATVFEQSTRYMERIAIYYGKNATADAMTAELLPPTEIYDNEDTAQHFRLVIKPGETGTYNIGFHAISDANQNRLYIDAYDIEDKILITAPDTVSVAKVTPDAEGYAKATVSCRLPEKTLEGADISGKVTLDVFRGETKIKTIQGDPGEAVSFNDITEGSGVYRYTFAPADASGKQGLKRYVDVFIGAYPPQPVTGRVGYNEGNMVRLNWEPVTADILGHALPEGSMTYNIYTIVNGNETGEKLNSEPIADNHFEFEIEAPAKQTTIPYAILPVNRDVYGDLSAFAVAAGPAYPMPLAYDDAADGTAYNLTTSGSARFPIGTSKNAVKPYSGKEYFVISFNGIQVGASYVTGKVAVTGQNPALSFMAFRNTTADVNEISVYVSCEGVEKEVQRIYNTDLKPGEWNNLKVSLAEYSGKNIQVRLEGYCLSRTVMYSYFDDIKFINDASYDVKAEGISAPELADNGQPFNVEVSVLNDAARNTGKFNVILYRDGEKAAETEVGDLAAYTSRTVRFRQNFTPAQANETVFYAEAAFDNDENKANNRTASVTVHRRTSLLPTVSGLTGERKGDNDCLKWDDYDPDKVETSEITEDFESGEPFGHNFSGWTFVDVDGMPVGGFGNYNIPGIEIGRTTASFFVFDTSAGSYSDSFKAHSGSKYLASLYRHDFGEVNDWLISPELAGCEQKISFWAKSYDPSTPEKIQLWYSTKGNDIQDFVMDKEFGTVDLRSYDWQEFTATLPEGTRYFAIRSMAEDSFMLMIDDITCTRVPVETGELLGYNIYCNNEKINPETVLTNSFTTPHNGLDLTYYVSALFENGESELSDPVRLPSSGITGNHADAAKVSVSGRVIRVQVAGDKAVAVSTVDGLVVYRGTGDAAISVSPAIYIVTVGGNAVKVAVR